MKKSYKYLIAVAIYLVTLGGLYLAYYFVEIAGMILLGTVALGLSIAFIEGVAGLVEEFWRSRQTGYRYDKGISPRIIDEEKK